MTHRNQRHPIARAATVRVTIARPAVPALVTGLALSLALLSSPAQASTLEIAVENVKSTEGSILVAIYNSADSYRKQAVWEAKVPVQMPVTRIAVPDLAGGQYAVALFQDRNGDGKVDSNLFGVPTEPYGFSNNPRSLMGPASWDQTRFDLGASPASIKIRLTD